MYFLTILCGAFIYVFISSGGVQLNRYKIYRSDIDIFRLRVIESKCVYSRFQLVVFHAVQMRELLNKNQMKIPLFKFYSGSTFWFLHVRTTAIIVERFLQPILKLFELISLLTLWYFLKY